MGDDATEGARYHGNHLRDRFLPPEIHDGPAHTHRSAHGSGRGHNATAVDACSFGPTGFGDTRPPGLAARVETIIDRVFISTGYEKSSE